MNRSLVLGTGLLAATLLVASGAVLQSPAVVAQSIDSEYYLPPSFDIGTMPPQPVEGGVNRPVELLASGR